METVVHSIGGIPHLSENDDLTEELTGRVNNADLIALASTAVSKVQGRVRRLESYEPSKRATEIASNLGEKDPRFAQAVLEESVELLIEEPFLLAVTRFGHIAPNAGIDRSNVEGKETVVLLPKDPNETAKRLREELGVPVVVTDTCGRPFRRGQTGVAVGWSGLDPIRDWRGKRGIYGKELEATEEALVDEIAGYANLHMGEGDGGVPAVAFENVEPFIRETGEYSLFRPEENDIVRGALSEFKE